MKDFKEWARHWMSYQRVARRLGVWKLRFIFHDLEKAILILIVGDRVATKVHRMVSSHHERNNSIKDVLGAIIDWECARYTKPSKQLNARQTLNKYYSHLDNYDRFLVVLDILGL